jgi:cyclophilin family peptidyl-prolyl cis-trans isomerase
MGSRKLAMAALVAFALLSAAIAKAADPTPAGDAGKGEKGGSKMAGQSAGGGAAGKNPVVVIATSLGDIDVELYPDKAPVTVKNFLDYVESKQYDGTVFHRVIKDFMIQGGGFTPDMKQKSTKAPIKNEAGNGLKNQVGTIAMARTSDVDSATAQFFINTKDNVFLDHKSETPQGFGYAVFGKVTGGLDVVRKIEAVSTTNKGMLQDVPAEPVVIKSITLKK